MAWEPVALDGEAEEVAAATEPPRLLHVVAWDEDAALQLTVPEPIVAEAETEPEPIVAEAEPEPEPMVAEAVEEEPAAAVVEPEPAPDAEAATAPRPPRIAPISETILRFPSERAAPSAPPTEPEATPVAAEDESPDVAARRAQLDLLGLGDPGEGPVTPERPAVLPYRSRGAAAPMQGTGFWEASAREVASAPANIGVQSCGECGLSLSANARFCRRCGTRQARSA
jgi:ribosomal protein L40E